MTPPVARPMTRTAWLLCDDRVLVTADVSDRLVDIVKGLAGHAEYHGALVLWRAGIAHSFGARFPIEVAFLDGDLTVVRTCRLVPGRIARPCRHGRHTLLAASGAFDRWALRTGDHLELRAPA